MKYALLSAKGQLTIPQEIQKQLGIAHRSKLILYPQRGALIVKPMRTSVVEQTAGSLTHLVPPDKKGLPWSTIMAETKKLAAQAIAKE